MRRKPIVWILAALFFFCKLDCGLAQPIEFIQISNAPYFKPKTPGEIKTVQDAMAAVISITSKDLGLPIVDPLNLHLHKNTNSYAASAGRSGRLASEVVQYSVAVAQDLRFHVNMERLRGRPWSALIKVLAHEYAHNIESLFSSLFRGSQWIREGFADWVGWKVLDSLGWQDYAISLHRAKLEVARQAKSLPTLAELEEPKRWNVWANQPNGAILTYRFAFLAVDQLMARGGVAAMERYFSKQDFATGFGISWRDFEKEFKASLNEPGTTRRLVERIDKPEWKVGQRWQYGWKAPGRSGSLTREIVKEDQIDGLDAYVLKVGNNEVYYSRQSLGLLATATQGKLIAKRSSPFEYFSWPLENGKEWRDAFILENLAQKSSRKFENVHVVAGLEECGVPAGSFECTRIETYAQNGGALAAEHWYAPGAKWFVKIREYLQDGVREEELTSFDSK
jgi:hypothetical protein